MLKKQENPRPITSYEESIIKLIKESCRLRNLKPEDWKVYGPKVINYIYNHLPRNIIFFSPKKNIYLFLLSNIVNLFIKIRIQLL